MLLSIGMVVYFIVARYVLKWSTHGEPAPEGRASSTQGNYAVDTTCTRGEFTHAHAIIISFAAINYKPRHEKLNFTPCETTVTASIKRV